MEDIIIILGPKTEEIHKILDVHHINSVNVIASYDSIESFHSEYHKKILRVDRIIITEGAFAHNPYDELTFSKEVLDSTFADYKEVFFLTTKNPATLELLEMLKSDLGDKGDLIRVFDNERYNAGMIINYCLGATTRRHFIDTKPEFDEIVRERINGEGTFILEDESNDNADTEIVVVESIRDKALDFETKVNNLLATANSHKDLTWEKSPLIKDISKLNELSDEAYKAKRYEIDYSTFYLKDKIIKSDNNVITVSGDTRSGKTSLSVALAKSFTATGKRVLMIETDLKSMGLSDFLERSGLPMTAMLTQDFLDFKNSIRTLANSQKKLNAIVANSLTIKDLGKINHSSFINMLVMCCKKYFDLVIVDMQLQNVEDCKPVIIASSKVVLTFANRLSSLVSTFKTVGASDILTMVSQKFILVPCSVFSEIDGLSMDTVNELTSATKHLFGAETKVLSVVKIKGLDLDDSLYRAINSK